MKYLFLNIAFLLFVLFAPVLHAKEKGPMIAVASNFMGAMEKIALAYEVKSGIKLQTVYSSTGKLYAQITKGAPYDLFFAADARRPELLADEGLCEKPFVYAEGEAVLWTKNKSFAELESWSEVITHGDIKKIAVSTPQTAPYGAAAIEALNRKGLFDIVENKFVYGHNVSQAFQFAFHGSADIGFTALSLTLSEKGEQGMYWRIPEAEEVVQKACVIMGSKNKNSVNAFLEFFHQPVTNTMLEEFGYK